MEKFNQNKVEVEIRCNNDGSFSSNSVSPALSNHYHTTALVIAVDFFEALKRTILNMPEIGAKTMKIEVSCNKEK